MNLTLGIYYPNCHCNEESIAIPQTSDIKLIMPTGKVNYFFKDKINWFYSWGYTDNDKQEFIEIIKTLTKKSFTNGNYEIENHTKYGVKINIFFDLPGKNEKAGRIYKTWTNFMIFPNGCLKNNTIIGGKNN